MIPNVELAYKSGYNRQTIFLDECPDSSICNGEWIGSLSGTAFILVCSMHSKDSKATFTKNRSTGPQPFQEADNQDYGK